MKKYIFLIIILILFLLALLLPIWLKDNILIFYGTVTGGIATLIAVIISITHDSFLAKEKRIPFLQTKMERMNIDEFKEQRYKLRYKYITEFDDSEDVFERELKCSELIRTCTKYNSTFYTVELYNTNKDFSVLGLSISVEGKIFVKDVFIKADSSFKYVIGYHTGIFKNTDNKSKTICVTYKYKSIDLDKTYEQKSHVCLYITLGDYPAITLFSPPISKRK